MVLDSNPSPYYNFDHINFDSISKIPDPDTSSHHQNLNFDSLLENLELPFQGKGKEVAMASSPSSALIFHQFLQLKSEWSENIELEEGEKKIKIESSNVSFPLYANPVRKHPRPHVPTIAEITTLSAKAVGSEGFSFSQFLHSPSCSPTRNSAKNNSIEQVWNAGEETVYDGVLDHSIMGACSSNPIPTISLPETQIEPVKPKPTPSLILNQEEIKALETNIRLKEAEANLFQRLADEARKELETYHMIQQATTKEKKMEEDHTSGFALLDVGVRKRKKSEEPYKNMGGQRRHIAKMRKRVDATMETLGPQCGVMKKGA